MSKRHIIKAFIVFMFFIAYTNTANAVFIERTCHGNLETFDKKIIKAGVIYKMSYEVSGREVKIRFAGREFDAQASENPSSYKGLWIRKMIYEPDLFYFSYLPDDGGTIKFQFAPDRWYSGNC